MALLPVTIIIQWLLTNAWNGWCVVLIVVIVMGAGAQDCEGLKANRDLPAQVLKGMDMSHSSY